MARFSLRQLLMADLRAGAEPRHSFLSQSSQQPLFVWQVGVTRLPRGSGPWPVCGWLGKFFLRPDYGSMPKSIFISLKGTIGVGFLNIFCCCSSTVFCLFRPVAGFIHTRSFSLSSILFSDNLCSYHDHEWRINTKYVCSSEISRKPTCNQRPL